MFVDFSRTYREHTVETHRAATMKRPARRSPTPSAPAPLCLWRLARPEGHVCWHEAHHLRALFIDAAPAAAPPAQAALTAQAALAVSPPPSLRVLIKDPVAASPGSETEEEELVDGICTFNGIRATPPRLLFTPTPPDSGGGVPDKFAPLCEVVWQSPPPRERGGSQVASPYFDKSTSDAALI